MPLDEEGAKWSCEPCIRGHRSSKCQHFDRLMMKVPKAGRPLAKCPHPKGSCSCQRTFSMMIRIPKGTGCVCRPIDTPEENSPRNSEPVSATRASLSSLNTPPASSKIQKPGRRQSSIQAVPENIARALESMPVNIKYDEDANETPTSLLSYPLDHKVYSHNSYQAMHAVPEASYAQQQTNGSSCCSKKPPPPPVAPSGGGSCCSGKASSGKPGPQPTSSIVSNVPELHQEHQQGYQQGYQQHPQEPSNWNGTSYSSFTPAQMAWRNPMPSAQPAQGRFMQPYGLQENHVPHAYMNGFSQSGPSDVHVHAANGLGITPGSISSYNSTPSQNSVYTPTNMNGDPSHDCQCGEECQCLGCASHPFNNTTRQRVQEMGEMMTIGDGKSAIETYQSPTFQGNHNWGHFNYLPQGLDHSQSMQQQTFDPYSDQSHVPQASNFPRPYASPVPVGHVMNEQLMHTSEYYTLEYPVGIPSACSDVTGSCQCGNDCSCVGCLTHSGHNGLPLEAPLQEPALPIHSNNDLVSSGEQLPTTTSSMHTSRIPVLENISVPCLSPRTLETSMI
ncbi:unnamed protein product [Penicillium pancosmium]